MALKGDKTKLGEDIVSRFSETLDNLSVDIEKEYVTTEETVIEEFAGVKVETATMPLYKYVVSGETVLNLRGTGVIYLDIAKDSQLQVNIGKYSNVKIFYIVGGEGSREISLASEEGALVENYVDAGAGTKVDFKALILNSRYFKVEGVFAERSNCDLSERYLSDKKNICYVFNQVTHMGSNSESVLDVKGLTCDGARAINDGEVKVITGVEEVVSDQKMKNFLKGELSSVESEPMLDISDNRVECSHSSSISRVEEETVKYVESRGLSKEEAENIVIRGLYEEIIPQNTPSENLLEKYL